MPGPRAGGPVVAAGSRRGRESGRTSPAAGPEARGRPRTRQPGVAATPVCAVPHPSPRRRPGPVRQSRRAGPRDSRRDSRRLGPGGRRTAPASRGRRSDTGPTASWADWAIHGPGVACLRTRAFRMRPGERTPAGRGGRTVRVPGSGEVRALSARREDPDGPTSVFSPVTLNDGLAKRFHAQKRRGLKPCYAVCPPTRAGANHSSSLSQFFGFAARETIQNQFGEEVEEGSLAIAPYTESDVSLYLPNRLTCLTFSSLILHTNDSGDGVSQWVSLPKWLTWESINSH